MFSATTSGSARVLVLFPAMSVARDFIDYPYFADLGTLQLAAVLRAAGHGVAVVDSFALPSSGLSWRPDGRAHLGAALDEVLAALPPLDGVDAVVVAYTPFHRPPARDDVLGALLAELRSRARSMPIILADAYQSGQHYVEADGDAVRAAYPEIDAWVKYEAEVTVPALVAELAAGRRPAGVFRGVAPSDLDALPFPAWDLVDLTALDTFRGRVVATLGRGAWAFPIDGRTLPLVTSRGCPFTCVHCSSNPDRMPGEPKTQRRYGAERLRAYLRTLVDVHRATRLEVLDELVNVNERHFDCFLGEVSQLDVAFDVPNGMRADYLEPRHFAAMAGRVTTVSVSAESGVQRVVDEVVHKRLDLVRIVDAARHAAEACVPLLVHFIVGMPGEHFAEIGDTLAFALDLEERFGATPAVQFSTPLPGTALARGRALPLIGDWGPAFQRSPSQPGMDVDASTLAALVAAFERRRAAARGPCTLRLTPTLACNSRCLTCTHVRQEAPSARLDETRTALRAASRGTVGRVDLDGGEPTLSPGLLAIVAEARERGVREVHLRTNARMFAVEPNAVRIARAGLTSATVALHAATPEVHDAFVAVPGAHVEAIAGLVHLARHVHDVGVELLATPAGLVELGEVVLLAARSGARRLRIRVAAAGTPAAATESETLAAVRAVRGAAVAAGVSLSLAGVPFCSAGELAPHVEDDAARLAGGIHYSASTGATRRVEAVCAACVWRTVCAGFYA